MKIKICCIQSIEEVNLAINYGASAVGLVSEMPSGPGVITEEKINEIVSAIPPNILSFLLTSKQDIPSIIEQHKRCWTNTIQLVDKLKSGTHQDLKIALPDIKIVQVIHVTGQESIEEAINLSPTVDALLLDSGDQSLIIKKLGGTGNVHNWDISKEIVKVVNIPVYLAGGLNPENIQEAIIKVNPYGVDICSGVRTSGNLDKNKLKIFFRIIDELYKP